VQNFSYIWKHRQHRLITQDVQEDLPGVGCAVTFFLCAISVSGLTVGRLKF
jgi:hypothetical protein